MREGVLLIGMLNSVHFANWLERNQFIDRVIYLYPSRQYRELHPKISEIVSKNDSIKIIKLIPILKISVIIEFLLDTQWLQWLKYFSRTRRLNRLLTKNTFSKIHALEIQHAGYLLTDALPRNHRLNNVIVTNWGSDI